MTEGASRRTDARLSICINLGSLEEQMNSTCSCLACATPTGLATAVYLTRGGGEGLRMLLKACCRSRSSRMSVAVAPADTGVGVAIGAVGAGTVSGALANGPDAAAATCCQLEVETASACLMLCLECMSSCWQ